MISFDFEYYRPATIHDALSTFKRLKEEGKQPIYYAGGTEIISQARLNQIAFGSAIDIKEIPECNVLEFQEGKLVIGAAMTLTRIFESGMFPLLGDVCKAAADHTARDKITLGGNLCSKLIYKEAALPFLLSDSEAVIACTGDTRKVPINQIFDQSLQLAEGEFLIQLITDKSFIDLPHLNRKRTKHGKVDYPLVAFAAVKKDNRIRVALSGLCSYPFRSQTMEDNLNDESTPLDMRINNAIGHLPGAILNDIQGSAEYRELVLRNMLADISSALGGVN